VGQDTGVWGEVREAFREKARMSNAAVGVEIVTWEAAGGDTFTLSRKDIEV
jgi:hypothetical protein